MLMDESQTEEGAVLQMLMAKSEFVEFFEGVFFDWMELHMPWLKIG